MKKQLFVWAFMILPLGLFATGTVSGVVYESDGSTAISGATISLHKDLYVDSTDTTDGSGNYSFTVEEGLYILRAVKSGKEITTVHVYIVDGQTLTKNMTMADSTASLTVTLTESDGSTAIGSATINLIKNNTLYGTATTNGSGVATITDLPAGSFTIVSQHSSYQAVVQGISLTANQTKSVSCSVSSGSPATVNATVTATSPSYTPIVNVYLGSVLIRTAETSGTSPTWTASLTGLPVEQLTFVGRSTGFRMNWWNATTNAGGTHAVTLTMIASAATLTGSVFHNTSGAAQEGALITVSTGDIVFVSTVTDSDGFYIINDLLAGSQYIMDVIHPDYESISTNAVLAIGRITPRNITLLVEPSTISGTVSDTSDNAIAGANVRGYSGSALRFSTFTDENGAFSAPSLSPETYVVTAFAADYQTSQTTVTTTTGETSTTTFTLAASPGTVVGRVTRTVGGSSIRNALVTIYDENNKLVGSAGTNATGIYTIRNLAAGTYTVFVREENFQSSSTTTTVTAGQTTTGVDFSLDASPNTVTGQVLNAISNAVLESFTVTLFIGNVPVYTTSTDPDGNYKFVGIAPGTYKVQAQGQDYVPSEQHDLSISGGGGTTTQNITNYSQDLNPTTITGDVIVNRFLLQADRIHKITWTPSQSTKVANYRIYRNDVLIATVSSETRSYEDHNRDSKLKDVYTVKTVNTDGSESSGVSVTLT